mgnify:CR=1 FL=1
MRRPFVIWSLWRLKVIYGKQKCAGTGGGGFSLNEFTVPVMFVAWEYKEGVSLSVEKYTEIVGPDHFLGEIYHDGSRQISENRGYTPYCFAIPGIIREQYKAIISKIMKFTEQNKEGSNDQL